MRCTVAGQVALGLVVALLPERARGSEAPGRFAEALDAARQAAAAKPNPLYNTRPLTIECWGRIRHSRGFHILVANEVKASPTHWEIYSYAGSGVFSLYMPGNRPAEIKSSRRIADGKWHYLAAVLDGRRIRLYVDGQQVANVPETRPRGLKGTPGSLAFGALVEGWIGCDGAVDEVRLSNAARPITRVPRAPFEADDHTIGLWHFDAPKAGKAFADASVTGNQAVVRAAGRRRPAGPLGPILAPPPEPDLARTRASLAQALARLKLPSLAQAGSTRDAVLRDWEEQWWHLDRRCRGVEKLPKGAAEQAFDRQALVWPSDRDPLGVVLRRSAALLRHLEAMPEPPALAALAHDLASLQAAARAAPAADATRRKGLFLAACALRRRIAFANPLLDFDRILFVARGVRGGSRKTGPRTTNDRLGQHFATQYYGFNALPGGGLFVVENFRTQPRLVDVVGRAIVQNGRHKGKRLDHGAFLSPDLSFDGTTIAFAWTGNTRHEYVWTKDTTWSLFKVGVDGSNLVQLTDSKWDDFDPCWLPNGRIAFISERRGGYIRCFRGLPVPQHSLHSMRPDGSDIIPISYFETTEWHPSVNHDGMLVYTRWDYVDRENCLGSNFWICNPDGRDPRAPHGNYPYPWHTFPDNRHGDSRIGRPYTEMNIRAIPGSRRYLFTAAPHHGESFGSLCILDLRAAPDDGFMSQIRRFTPYVRFPESETVGRSQYPYGTAWPLSEDLVLCNWWESLTLLDRFGNRVLLCENSLAFGGTTNWDFRLIDPIPLRPRPRPPVVPTQTTQSAQPPATAPTATIAVLNVYDSDLPFPPGTRIRWLRVIQNVLKPNPEMGRPMVGYQAEACPRIPLGIVPVEADGSACFEAPAGKQLIFQVLDERYMAVQSMRSVAYVHDGERLVCIGCHENPQRTPATNRVPRALTRPPSKLQPEIGPVEPIFYYRHVQPIVQGSCVPCHRKERKGPVDMSYGALRHHAFHFDGGMRGTTIKPLHGGSRTIPGRFGARHCRLGRSLLDEHHRGKVAERHYRTLVLWLDSNSPRLGAFYDEDKQRRGDVVWPRLDVDPRNPLGLADGTTP